MASRPRGYGLTSEIRRKIDSKYDEDLEQEARVWIELLTGESLDPDADPNKPLGQKRFQECLKNGVLLCILLNKIWPNSVRKINRSKMPFTMMENIAQFLESCESHGTKKTDMFQTVDLYEGQNMVQVVNAIHALGRLAQKNGFNGPTLGPKESHANPRQFSQDVLKAGDGVIGLQMGTNRGASQAGTGGFMNRRDINWTDNLQKR